MAVKRARIDRVFLPLWFAGVFQHSASISVVLDKIMGPAVKAPRFPFGLIGCIRCGVGKPFCCRLCGLFVLGCCGRDERQKVCAGCGELGDETLDSSALCGAFCGGTVNAHLSGG